MLTPALLSSPSVDQVKRLKPLTPMYTAGEREGRVFRAQGGFLYLAHCTEEALWSMLAIKIEFNPTFFQQAPGWDSAH